MKCTAHRKSDGAECKLDAIQGGTVCHKHGGSAPQVKAAARLRLAALVDPAIKVLLDSMKQRSDKRVRLQAAADVLDRAGLKEPDKLIVEGDLSLTETLRARRQKRGDES